MPLVLSTAVCAVLCVLLAGHCSTGEAGERSVAGLEFRFDGNSAFSDSRLRSLCRVSDELSEEEQLEAVRQAALQAYRDAGFLQATIETTYVVDAERERRAVVRLKEGEPARLVSFKFLGNRHVSSEELTKVSDLRTGTVLSGRLLEQVLERLVEHMTDVGFPFAAARAGDFTMSERGVGLTFFIDEGPLCTFGEIELVDSEALTSGALQGALGVTSGAKYCEKELRNGVVALRRTALFAEVGQPIVSASGRSKVRVAVPVKERKTTSFAGAVGFRGRANELTGGLSLSLLNIARTGRSAKASWEAMGRKASSFSLAYAEPWVMGLPFSSSLSLEHVVRDTLFAGTEVSLLCRVPLSPNVSAEAGTSFEKTLAADGPASRSSRFAWLAGMELSLGAPHWMGDDSFLVALRGSRGTKKTVLLESDKEKRDVLSTLEGRALLQRRIGRSQIALLDAKASSILEGEDSAALDELFSLGGKRTLRGYSERQFLASTVSSVQIEYGVLIGSGGGRAFVLLDLGYASTQALSLHERLHAGYGAGLRIPSSFGVAGVDFAIPAGEPVSSGKIHVGLEGTF